MALGNNPSQAEVVKAIKDLENNSITSTSDLTNDGDGNSPFATESQVQEYIDELGKQTISSYYGTFPSVKPLMYTGLLVAGSTLVAGSFIAANSTGYDEDTTLDEDLTLEEDIILAPYSNIENGSTIEAGSILNHEIYDATTTTDLIQVNEFPGQSDFAYVTNSVIDIDFNDINELEDYVGENLDFIANGDYAWVVNGNKFDLYQFNLETLEFELVVNNITKASAGFNTIYNTYKFDVDGNFWYWSSSIPVDKFTQEQWAVINGAGGGGGGVQSVTTGSTNGTLSVDGTDVAVYGLGSNAFNSTPIPTNYVPNNSSSTITGDTDTPLYLKSNSTSSYLGFKNSSGTNLGYFGVNSSNKPVFYDSSDHQLAYTSDIPSTSDFVTLSGDQTIDGNKVFKKSLIVRTKENGLMSTEQANRLCDYDGNITGDNAGIYPAVTSNVGTLKAGFTASSLNGMVISAYDSNSNTYYTPKVKLGSSYSSIALFSDINSTNIISALGYTPVSTSAITLGTTGGVKLSNGLIINWGKSTPSSGVISGTFKYAFTTNVTAIVGTNWASATNNTTTTLKVTSKSKTSFTGYCTYRSSGTGIGWATEEFCWMAIGY